MKLSFKFRLVPKRVNFEPATGDLLEPDESDSHIHILFI